MKNRRVVTKAQALSTLRLTIETFKRHIKRYGSGRYGSYVEWMVEKLGEITDSPQTHYPWPLQYDGEETQC